MNVFLDANVLVSVLIKQYPLFSHAAKLLSLQEKMRLHFFTSPICLAIAFYFAEKKSGTSAARKKILLLSEHLKIAPCGGREVMQASKNPKVLDYEDGLEYYAAVNAGCKCIITENAKDFYFSEIEVLGTEDFLKKYVLYRK